MTSRMLCEMSVENANDEVYCLTVVGRTPSFHHRHKKSFGARAAWRPDLYRQLP